MVAQLDWIGCAIANPVGAPEIVEVGCEAIAVAVISVVVVVVVVGIVLVIV